MVGDGTHDLSTPFQRGRQLARLSTVLALLWPPRHGQRAGQAPGRVSLSLQLSHTDRNRGAVRSPGPDEHREYPCCLPHYAAPTARALPRTNGLFLLFIWQSRELCQQGCCELRFHYSLCAVIDR